MRLSSTPIEPVRKTRTVPLDPAAAFELFTDRMARWWPLVTHSLSEDPASDVRFEGRVGGRVVEISPDGTEHSWADVVAWDPPHRFVLAWHPNPEPDAASILEVRFEPAGDGTVVTLEHRGWEEFGAEEGLELRGGYDQGWELVLAPFEAAAAQRVS